MPSTMNTSNCDVAIMARIFQPGRGDLPLTAARSILKLTFAESDRERMHVLLQKGNAGTLTAIEERELDDYERVGHLLDMLHAKARKALKKHTNGR